MATGIIMADVAGKTLDDSDKALLANPEIGGMILFARNVESPQQVRQLTDAMRAANPDVLIAVDQEGGRVARFRQGFSPLPAMGKLGELYDNEPERALALAYDCGYLMACEVLAVGVDFSFAPVLDINGVSLVIGDRAFHAKPDAIIALSARFMDGMKDAGMATTGKHFPGHGSIAPDSHVADAIDTRSFDEVFNFDTQTFVKTLDKLDALMPAHVIFSQVDDKPAGFSKIWIDDIIRRRLKFDGVVFSDDLCMKAAHIAGDVDARVIAAIDAGCDMALVCNHRDGALLAIDAAKRLHTPPHNRFTRMKGNIPTWQGSLEKTCEQFANYQAVRERVQAAFFVDACQTTGSDPTHYQKS
ncbi:beta-N-acetylhexosaminidase [Moraxella marmotae]|uniref:beta-N-acetylhexosaminidase n=1 Tax=Moraxella marmotae TaxID=3344520 RepID=UPI0035F341C7